LITLAIASDYVTPVIVELRLLTLNGAYESNTSQAAGVAPVEGPGRDWQVCTIMSRDDFSRLRHPGSRVVWAQPRNSLAPVHA